MIPATSLRVPLHTSDAINERIRQEMHERVARYRDASPEAITRRLEELDEEWDVERVLEANAASIAFTGCLLTAAVDRRWIFLPLAVTAFLFEHALQGWCPPVPVIRRLGVRTMREIDEERFALKALRGDFHRLASTRAMSSGPDAVLQAVEM
jgi:hypothetical protein